MSFKTIALESSVLLQRTLRSTLTSHTSTFTQHSEYACGKTQALQRIPPRDTLGEPGMPGLPCMDSKN